ncbi:hypothetical protein PybrP1_007970 [[Pythium] brassicae (nom. inval.)]|nr:hypothetical protein PybrP1_007970 [[Pythium] brassicae (nom. inval.)]
MLSPTALSGLALALATAALVAPSLRRQRASAYPVPLGTWLAFDARVRWQALLLWASGVSRELEVLPAVAAVAPGVLRVLGQNPSRLTLRGTNTYLVGRGATRILVDASDGNDAYIAALLRTCHDAGVREISHVLLTHGHLDHMGGILRVREAFPRARMLKYLPRDDAALRVSNAECALLGVEPLADGAEFPVDNGDDPSAPHEVLRAVYTPGHCIDHMCFVLENTQESAQRVLFSGDCVLGAGSCIFESLKELMDSLALLQAQNPRVIFPGHGPVVVDAQAKIHEYISHREQRENEVLAVLAATATATATGPASAGLSSAEIVRRIYEKLPFALQLAARKAVEKHLHKLVLEQRVERVGGAQSSSWWLWRSAPTFRLVGGSKL